MTTWDEHLAQCKKTALAYVDRGELADAVASMGSDIQKHPETKMSDAAIGSLIYVAMLRIMADDVRGVREWIEGFR
jgi:hypothetical protein